MKVAISCSVLFALFGLGLAQQNQNPFAPPSASMHYAPDRTCDLVHLRVDLDVDYSARKITGVAVNTMTPLRKGISDVTLHAGTGLDIAKVTVNGKQVAFKHEGRLLLIHTGPVAKGVPLEIAVSYSAANARGRSFGGGGGGWHWINATASDKNHIGFWTQGESEYNSEWVPTWDYPNDLTTSETRTTVPADWNVIGNGVLVSEKLSADKKKKTFDWKMDQPHATYLLSLCGGPFDIKKDSWEGVQLWYVVPRGHADQIDASFGHTKDMLSFYSSVLGVKYAWPKYAQDAMWDFGGGMENVSATTLGAGSLTDAKDGWFRMDSLNAHELAHQWFGDLVTCKDWGDIWLNESFATFMQCLYFEHSRGINAYQWEIYDNLRGYLNEARRYKRPLSTKMYPNGDAMFDSHTYPKGGDILHTLRCFLGDENFFAGLNYYLTKWRHTPVESAQLRRAFIEATGINVEPFWAQWIEKPGHPVLEYSWSYENGNVKLSVNQKQSTSDGTPIYDIEAHVDLLSSGGSHDVRTVHLSKQEDTFKLPCSVKPAAVILDPKQEFLREIPDHQFSAEERRAIVLYAYSAPDRQDAFNKMLANPSQADIDAASKAVMNDSARFPALRSVDALAALEKPELRSLWLHEIDSLSVDRQLQSVRALARLPKDNETIARLRKLVSDAAPTQVCVAAINALANWDAKGNIDLFKNAEKYKDRRGAIKRAADSAIEKANGS